MLQASRRLYNAVHLKCSPLSLRSVPAVYAIGLNFHSHAREVGLEGNVSKYPVVIMKGPNSVVTSSHHEVRLPSHHPDKHHHHHHPTSRLEVRIPKFLQEKPEIDYEGELAVIIGKRCKNVTKEDAVHVIEGVTCAVDVTARRWQGKKGGGQWSYAKSFDTFCPLGPQLVHIANLSDIKRWTLTTKLNGSVVQDAPLSDMIFDVPHLVSFLSQGVTLEAGTVILCGTPSGVGYRRTVPYYLRDGDTLDVSIGPIGSLHCIVRNE
jgi:2-keto-4-pentenoate hydratase/2-oxohepta-3-ene-1,7-dioic acid hydratase in catechol pathway